MNRFRRIAITVERSPVIPDLAGDGPASILRICTSVIDAQSRLQVTSVVPGGTVRVVQLKPVHRWDDVWRRTGITVALLAVGWLAVAVKATAAVWPPAVKVFVTYLPAAGPDTLSVPTVWLCVDRHGITSRHPRRTALNVAASTPAAWLRLVQPPAEVRPRNQDGPSAGPATSRGQPVQCRVEP